MSRGRGRGRGGSSSLSLEAIGFKKGDTLAPTLQPPPDYPLRVFKPTAQRTGPLDDYLLTVKQDLANSFKSSRFYLQKPVQRKRIEKYSDKYEMAAKRDEVKNLEPWDLRLFPDELKPATSGVKKRKVVKNVNLDMLAKGEENSEESNAEEEVEETIAVNEEEEIEEETDYAQGYFDNGESYLENSDNDDEGPTY
ncbi:DNA-directed RNA polymerase III subunit RPC7-like [Halotydeus destructor]|nr:DNA-directed RNA polymerase III subunit RPC7-like [Halotydeus destructor]